MLWVFLQEKARTDSIAKKRGKDFQLSYFLPNLSYFPPLI